MKGEKQDDPIASLPELDDYLEDMFQTGDVNRPTVYFDNTFLRYVGGLEGVKKYSYMWFVARHKRGKPGLQPDFSLEEIERAQEVAQRLSKTS